MRIFLGHVRVICLDLVNLNTRIGLPEDILGVMYG